MQHLVLQAGCAHAFEIASAAVSTEEIGNDIYPPMKKELVRRGIPFTLHQAKLISLEDFESSDYVFYMDVENHYMLVRRFGESKKILPVFQFSKDIHEIEDPWWTGNFKKVVDQLTTCIKDIIENI